MDTPPLLRELVEAPGPSGHEDAVRAIVRREVEPLAPTRTDPLGNLIAEVGRGGPRVLFVAHLDEVGLMVSHVEDDGYLRVRKLGTLDDRLLAGRLVEIHTERGPVAGVLSLPPPHLALGEPRPIPWYELYLDVGAIDRAEVERLGIQTMDPISFPKEFAELNGRCVSCWALDDRFGCYTLVEWLKHAAALQPDYTAVFAWSVQEEIGLRGAQALAAELSYDYVIPVDAFATSDAPGHPRSVAYAPLGSGPVARALDQGAYGSRTLIHWLQTVAREANLPLQLNTTGGETAGKELQVRGAHMLPLGIPVRSVHSGAELIDLEDLATLVALGKALLERLPRFLTPA